MILMIIDIMFRYLEVRLWFVWPFIFLLTCIFIWCDAMCWVLRQSDEEKEELRAYFEEQLV
jgi:hypothetical protein